MENSPLNVVSCAADSSPLARRLMCRMFGRVSSSEMNGSSIAMVEGKKRFPVEDSVYKTKARKQDRATAA